MNHSAFTTKYQGIVRELRNDVSIISKYTDSSKNAPPKNWRGLWDTGASITCVHRRVRDYMHLTPMGTSEISTANGVIEVDTHIVDIVLPNRVIVKDLLITSAEIGDDVDVLLGMDIICLGGFSVTNLKETYHSLIIPSGNHIDYVQKIKTMNQVHKGHRRKKK